MNAFAAAEQNGKAAKLQGELEELFARQNKSEVAGATSIPATFSTGDGPRLSSGIIRPIDLRREGGHL
jgi:hypothetical protein